MTRRTQHHPPGEKNLPVIKRLPAIDRGIVTVFWNCNALRMMLQAIIVIPFLLYFTDNALAGGHYVVNDADLIDPRSIELEVWHTDVDGGGYGTYISPTFRLNGNYQFTLVGAREREAGNSELVFGVEGKYLFRDMADHGFGLAFALGAELGAEDEAADRRWNEFFALVPVSVEPIPDRLLIHANLGVERNRTEDDKYALVWGVASELAITDHFGLIGELFGDDRGDSHPMFQGGFRFMLLDDRVALDLSYLRELGGEKEEAYTLGVTVAAYSY